MFHTRHALAETKPVPARTGESSGAPPVDKEDDTKQVMIPPVVGQLTLGSAMGFCAGYALKKVGRVGAVAVGVSFIGLQSLAYFGFIDINWMKIERKMVTTLDVNQDGKLDQEDAKIYANKIVTALKFQLPSSAGFAAAFFLGLRTG